MIFRYAPLVAIAFFWSIGDAHATRIDCGKAKTKIERLICDDSDIRNQDARLAEYFDKIVSTAPKSVVSQTRESQRAWIKSVRNRCGDRDCLAKAYALRQNELLKSGIPEDIDEDDPEDYCIKKGIPTGGVDCTAYVMSRGRDEREKKLGDTYKLLLDSVSKSSSTYVEMTRYQERWSNIRDKHCDEYGEANGGAASWNAVKESECRDEMALGQIEILRNLLTCVKKKQECHAPKSIAVPEPD